MPTYATVDEFKSYVADIPLDTLSLPDDEAIERLLERAERDVDRIAGPWPVLSTGRRFAPDSLTTAQQDALMRATCAQAEFRLAMGEFELIGADDGIAGVAGVVTFATKPLPRVGPKVIEELAGSGLYLYSGALPPEA